MLTKQKNPVRSKVTEDSVKESTHAITRGQRNSGPNTFPYLKLSFFQIKHSIITVGKTLYKHLILLTFVESISF